MERLPFALRMELEEWRLLWARLEIGNLASDRLARVRDQVAADARRRFADTSAISSEPTVAALRTLFRAAGCDPTRYRPASEALLRRLVKGDALPTIHPLVDLNNCLSATLAVPCCVMADGSFGRDLVWRSGTEGESYESLRGPFNLAGKPVLSDETGPLDTPITGNVRVKVAPDTEGAWLVAYTPAATVDLDHAREVLDRLRAGTGIEAEHYAS